jgi:hypothetical protein
MYKHAQSHAQTHLRTYMNAHTQTHLEVHTYTFEHACTSTRTYSHTTAHLRCLDPCCCCCCLAVAAVKVAAGERWRRSASCCLCLHEADLSFGYSQCVCVCVCVCVCECVFMCALSVCGMCSTFQVQAAAGAALVKERKLPSLPAQKRVPYMHILTTAPLPPKLTNYFAYKNNLITATPNIPLCSCKIWKSSKTNN